MKVDNRLAYVGLKKIYKDGEFSGKYIRGDVYDYPGHARNNVDRYHTGSAEILVAVIDVEHCEILEASVDEQFAHSEQMMLYYTERTMVLDKQRKLPDTPKRKRKAKTAII